MAANEQLNVPEGCRLTSAPSVNQWAKRQCAFQSPTPAPNAPLDFHASRFGPPPPDLLAYRRFSVRV